MLNLGRKVNETIRIGDDIVVMITAIHRNKVGIGITAPEDVVILRGELDKRESPAAPQFEDVDQEVDNSSVVALLASYERWMADDAADVIGPACDFSRHFAQRTRELLTQLAKTDRFANCPTNDGAKRLADSTSTECNASTVLSQI